LAIGQTRHGGRDEITNVGRRLHIWDVCTPERLFLALRKARVRHERWEVRHKTCFQLLAKLLAKLPRGCQFYKKWSDLIG
jgi:hypothetical protein